MFKWIEGRQNSGYYKLPLIISERFKCDFYILKIPAGVAVPEHTDPSLPGYEHHRLNFSMGSGEKMLIDGPISRLWRFDYFRPDLHKHSLPALHSNMYMLSLGWLKKDKHGQETLID